MIAILLLAVTVSSAIAKVEYCHVCHYGNDKEAMALQKLIPGSKQTLAEYEDKECGGQTGVLEKCPQKCAIGTVEDEEGNEVAIASGCFDGKTELPTEINGKKAHFEVCSHEFCNVSMKKLRSNKTRRDSKPKKPSDEEDTSEDLPKNTIPSEETSANTTPLTETSAERSAENELSVDPLTTKSKPMKALDPTTKKRVLKRTTRSAKIAKDSYAKAITQADDCTTTTPKPKSAAAIFSGIKIITLCVFLRVLY